MKIITFNLMLLEQRDSDDKIIIYQKSILNKYVENMDKNSIL